MKLFVENLTNIDFSFIHPVRGLMGESWLVQLELAGSLNAQGMVCDFGIVKKLVRDWMDRVVDHVLIVPTGLESLQIVQDAGTTEVIWRYPEGDSLVCRSPSKAITLIDVAELTPDTLAHWCESQLLELFPEEVRGLKLAFVPEQKVGAYYHYSHGLHQHSGNCQRIAHGHRSSIEVYLNGERSPALEKKWADHWQDIYIGTDAHRQVSDDPQVNIYRYAAPQGEFYLSLPARRCYDIATESTVEQIAVHLASRIKMQKPLDEVTVRAFEGIGKGAVATA